MRVLTFGLSPVIKLGIRHSRTKDKIQPGCVHGGHGCVCVCLPPKKVRARASFVRARARLDLTQGRSYLALSEAKNRHAPPNTATKSEISNHTYSNYTILLNSRTNEWFTFTELPRSSSGLKSPPRARCCCVNCTSGS